MVDVASRAGGSLSELDLVKIKEILPYDTNEEQLQEIVTILSHTRAVADEDNIEVITGDYDFPLPLIILFKFKFLGGKFEHY